MDSKERSVLPVLASSEEATNWAEQYVIEAEQARLICDVTVPGHSTWTVQNQKRAERVYLVRHGAALGVLAALVRCNMISANAYNGLVERVRVTLLPSIVGVSQ